MSRPTFITQDQIENWTEQIKSDPLFPHEEAERLGGEHKEAFFESCFAGFYLAEELVKLSCPTELILRIQYTAGNLSFGRDPWEEHLKVLEAYKRGELLFEGTKQGDLN